MGTPKLRKMALTITKDASGSDTRQVPASSVSVAVYKKGATSDRTQSVTNSATGVSVWTRDARNIAVGDVLQKGTAATPSITVTAVPNDFQLTVDSDGNGTMSLVSGDRLVIKGPGGRLPTLYTESSGVATTGSLSTDSNGYAECYVKERFVDVIASGGGVSARLLADEPTGDDEMWLNVLNYASIQAAIDAAPVVLGLPSATVYIPNGVYAVPSTINVNKQVRIVGDGPAATILLFDSSKNVDIFNVTSSFVSIENLALGFSGTPGSGTGRGIVYNPGASGATGLIVRNVQIYDSPSWAIRFRGNEDTNLWASHSLLEKVQIYRPRADGGIHLGFNSFVTKITSCVIDLLGAGSAGYCIWGSDSTLCEIVATEPAPATNTTAVHLVNAINGLIDDCDIETASGSTAYPVVIDNGKSFNVRGNFFINFDKGVHFTGGSHGMSMGNVFRNVTADHVTFTNHTQGSALCDRAENSGGTLVSVQVAEAGSTNGTLIAENGTLQVPRYATGSLPAGGAKTVRAGSLAYDTSTNTLKVLRNDLTTWANVP